jgi:hypothetical protein
MELLRALLFLIVSVPQIDETLPATAPVAKARVLLVRPDMSPEQVQRSLGLRKYQWFSGGNAGDQWFASYLSPSGDHTVTVHYLLDRRTCELRLKTIEIK